MKGCVATYANIRRRVFDKVSNRIESDDDLYSVIVYYNGTNLYGDVRIEGRPGNQSAYQKALQIFLEEYCE